MKVRQSALQTRLSDYITSAVIFLLAFHKRSTATYQSNHALAKGKHPDLFRTIKSNS